MKRHKITVKNLHISTISLRMGASHDIGCVPQRPYCYTPQSFGDALLLPMEYIHPPNRFVFTDLAEVDLGCFQILVS